MARKIHPALDELRIWLRARFSLTDEEKRWILLILAILWVGLLGRYIQLHRQPPQPLPPQEMPATQEKF
jgi:hypothetical protein